MYWYVCVKIYVYILLLVLYNICINFFCFNEIVYIYVWLVLFGVDVKILGVNFVFEN